MAALVSRITPKDTESDCPEDYLSTSLGVIYPDDVANNHGDTDQPLIYESPRLPKPLFIELADPEGETERKLFSHHLWNASLLLAELIERDSLDPLPGTVEGEEERKNTEEGSPGKGVSFDVRGLETLELGAGTALPSMMAALLGAKAVAVTDYPAPAVMRTLRTNIARNIRQEHAPPGASTPITSDVLVAGHEWGIFTASSSSSSPPSSSCDDAHFAASKARSYDRLLIADCLWMPWQHASLRRSIDHFLRDDGSARCWVVAGFHTGRATLAHFFDGALLRREGGVEVESMWERECDGREGEWDTGGEDDITARKRWLVVAVLKRC